MNEIVTTPEPQRARARRAAQAPNASGGALDPGLVAELRRVLGADGVITDAGALLVYESDGLTAYRIPPRAVLLPRGSAQVAAVVRRLAEAGVPFVPRGAGTGLSGGALALEGAVVLSLARMDRILDLDPANRRARVEPGVVNVRLSRAAAPHGLYYAPDPSSQAACTIGGNVAENAGGPHCLKHGATTNHILGLTVVLPDGEVVELGGNGEPVGYDLVGLFVGSEGTFGVATEIVVRLSPLPEAVETLLAIFDRVDDASRAVSAVIAEGLLPAALEMIDRETIRAVEASVFAAGYPTDAGAALVVEFDGPRAGLGAEAEQARSLCLRAGAREVRRAGNEAEREKLWQGRKKAFGAMGRLAPDLLVQDAVVPRTRLPAVLARIYEIAAHYQLRIANVFHAGDGNLHPNILFDRRDPEELQRVERASQEIMQACVSAGGSITGEHGVGLDKREYMELIFGDAELAVMCDVRGVFNPRGLANPAKVLPVRICREWAGPGTRVVEPALGVRQPAGSSTVTEAAADAATRRHGDTVTQRRGAAEESPRASASPREGIAAAPDGDIAAALRDVVGTEGLRPPGRWAVHGVVPRAVVAPADTAQMAAVLALASREGWAVEPAGGGTWLDGGPPPARLDVALTTERLTGVIEYEPADLTAVVGAGMRLDELRRRLGAARQWLPLDPPAAAAATLGAAVARADAGPLRLAYGTPRDHVLGLELVTGDGRVLELGGRVVKNVAGYDVVKLVVGSRGTLGVVTRVNLRLRPVPEHDATVAVLAQAPEPLLELSARVRAERLEVAAIELLSPPLAIAALGEPEHALLVRVHGRTEATQDARRRLAGFAPGGRVRELAAPEAALAWARLAQREVESQLVLRLADLPARLPDTLRLARALPLGRAGIAAHADGIVRVLGETDRAAAAELAGALVDVRRELAGRGGTLVLARAPAALHDRVPAFGDAGATLPLLRQLKAAFDPAGVLARGRFLV